MSTIEEKDQEVVDPEVLDPEPGSEEPDDKATDTEKEGPGDDPDGGDADSEKEEEAPEPDEPAPKAKPVAKAAPVDTAPVVEDEEPTVEAAWKKIAASYSDVKQRLAAYDAWMEGAVDEKLGAFADLTPNRRIAHERAYNSLLGEKEAMEKSYRAEVKAINEEAPVRRARKEVAAFGKVVDNFIKAEPHLKGLREQAVGRLNIAFAEGRLIAPEELRTFLFGKTLKAKGNGAAPTTATKKSGIVRPGGAGASLNAGDAPASKPSGGAAKPAHNAQELKDARAWYTENYSGNVDRTDAGDLIELYRASRKKG